MTTLAIQINRTYPRPSNTGGYKYIGRQQWDNSLRYLHVRLKDLSKATGPDVAADAGAPAPLLGSSCTEGLHIPFLVLIWGRRSSLRNGDGYG